MKRILAATWTIVMLLAGTAAAVAADYLIDLTHSHVLFMVDHLGFAKMVGLFTNFSGNFSLDPENIAARLSCFLKFDVNESSFSGSKVELQAASFDLLVYSVEGLTKRGGESGRGVENIGELGAEEPGMGTGEEQRDA